MNEVEMSEIGVVGLGNMGGGMARRLLQLGRKVVGFDVVPAAMARFESAGGTAMPSPAMVARSAAVVICSLPDPKAVREAVAGEQGVLAGAKPGSTLIETSTIDPITIRDLAERCGKAGVGLLDATLSGQPPQAESGELVMFVGGPAALLEQHRELLSALTRQFHHTGDIGTAKTVKLVNNLMALGNTAVAAEAFLLGVRCGMEPQRLYDILSTSGGRSHHFNYDFPRVIVGDFRPGFKTTLALKDISLIIDLAQQEGYPVELAPVLRRLYQQAVEAGHGDEHFSAVIKLFEARSGTSLPRSMASEEVAPESQRT